MEFTVIARVGTEMFRLEARQARDLQHACDRCAEYIVDMVNQRGETPEGVEEGEDMKVEICFVFEGIRPNLLEVDGRTEELVGYTEPGMDGEAVHLPPKSRQN